MSYKVSSLAVVVILLVVSSQTGADDLFGLERQEMVENQIRARGITDEGVLSVMEKVLRHEFVPKEVRHHAYKDHPLPIGEGQTISQPYIVALMTEALKVKKGDRVLEIGTGSGYQAAILGELAKEVYTIEIVPALGKMVARTLKRLGYKNVHVKIGDGYKGWPEHAPFDAIILTCAPEEIPRPLVDQLKEGGRMILPVGPEEWVQDLVLVTKSKDGLKKEVIAPVRFVPMTGKAKGK